MYKVRIVVFLSGNGTATARCPGEYAKGAWASEVDNLRCKGFHPFTSFNIPMRNLPKHGFNWKPFYRYWLKWAVHALGI